MKSIRRFISKSVFFRLVAGVVFIYYFCEYVTHYLTQIQCWWPSLKKEPANNVEPVYVMILADIHLVGSLYGHWFDRWRRETQMQRTFQTAMTLHRPDVVFVLGDLFDEGRWCSESEFDDYVKRFYSIFKVPEGTKMYTVVGNQDIGYHYRAEPKFIKRFETKLNSSLVELVSIRGNHFVLINSIAMQGDKCTLCTEAMTELDKIADVLKCSRGSPLCKGNTKLSSYSRPIIMQHFPLYRYSDRICLDRDRSPLHERYTPFIERWDSLSKESTTYLVENLKPRAVFAGHTHHTCTIEHTFEPTEENKIKVTEYTVPSFNWRYRYNPKYFLVTMTPNEIRVTKCDVITEVTLQLSVPVMFAVLMIYLWYHSYAKNTLYYKNLSGKKV